MHYDICKYCARIRIWKTAPERWKLYYNNTVFIKSQKHHTNRATFFFSSGYTQFSPCPDLLPEDKTTALIAPTPVLTRAPSLKLQSNSCLLASLYLAGCHTEVI